MVPCIIDTDINGSARRQSAGCRADREPRQAFDALITDVVHREGFADSTNRVAFVGVSQGAIVALDAVASGRWKLGALIAFSGLLAPQQVSRASSHTPVLLIHGKDDTTIPTVASTLAAAQLGTAGSRSRSTSKALDIRFPRPAQRRRSRP